MDKDIYKECIGCQAICFPKSRFKPIYRRYDDNSIVIECPCIECIVKATCREICFKYHKFEQKRESLHRIVRDKPYRRFLLFPSQIIIKSLTNEEIEKGKIWMNF